MKTKSRNFLITSLTMIVMMLAILFSAVAISPLTAYAASSVRVDFCLTNGALENNVFFENDSSKYFMSQQTKADGTLTSLEELYRTDNLDLEFDGWYTEKGEKVSLETVFTEYTILYDRWKPTTLTDEDIISTLEIGTPLLEVGQTAGTYDASSILLTDNRLSVQSVSVYEGLNAYRTNKLDDSDVLEAGKSYSLRVELHTKNGELIDDQLMSHSTATYGLVANMVYSHDNSGIFTTQWTNRENKIQVIINYDFENYCFTSDLEDKVVENEQSPQYTVYVSNNANIQGMELFVKNANDTWASLGAVTGQFNIPANSNVVKQYRVEVTYQNGFVISSNTFKVDWYDPNAPKFITQPTDYDVAYGTNVQVSWALNFDSSSIVVERKNGENWVEYQSAYNDGAHISPMPESGTYTFRAHATKNGVDYYSNEFTITWREKFEFTTQPQSMTVVTGEAYTITWKINQTPSILQVWFDDGTGNYKHIFNINDTSATSFTFNASDFAYSRSYKLMANYDNTVYFSDIFTIDIIAGEFTSKPDSTINAIVGNDCLVEWDFTLDVKYYNIKVHDGNDFVQFATTNKPEYIFTASEVGEKQFFIQAYNANDEKIGEDYLLFTIKWTEKQTVYLVSFNANGGTGTMQPVEQNAGSQYTLPDCTFTAPDGKIFKAWSVNDVEKKVGDKITINANTVVKAVWEDNLYQVIYQPGDASGNNEVYEYEANNIITFLDCEDVGYTRDGFEFDYWSIRIYGDNFTEVEQKRANETYTLTTDIIAVAMWKEVTAVPTGITATYSGTILAGNKINPSGISITLNYSNSSNEPVNAGIVEYWYNGSQIQDPINYVFGVELIGNLNITVKYQGFETTMAVQVVGYEIAFNANGGTGDMQPVEYVGEYTLPTCAFTAPDGKKFKGWSTSANGEVIDGTTYDVTEPVTLYAIWENSHECVGVLQSGQGATCIVDGWKDYYRCECGKYYEDANCQTPINDLEAWKVGEGKIVAKHTYGDLIPEESAVHTQTELKAGMKAHYKCSVCQGYFDENKNPTTEGALIIAKPEHSYGDWVKDNEKHWKVCSCGLKADEHTHNYTDNADMICNDCGYDRTVQHTHGNGTKQNGQGATCTVNGWKDYYKCSCGKIYTDAACTNEITSFEEWKNGDGKIAAVHSYGDLIAKVDATCSATGMQAHFECSVCHTLFDADKAVKTENELTIAIDANAHTYGAWTSNGDGTHTRVCGINGNHKETVACSGGTATCTEKAVCEVCNTAYGEALGHDARDVWSTDADNHWHECTRCEEQLDKAAHADENSDGKCDTCDYAMGTPENPGGDIEPEKTGLSGGAIAGIAVGSVAVAGLGGFSLLWFVIKKKSFADLIALFKKK